MTEAAASPRAHGRVVFAGCARDVGRHLDAVLANIEAIGSLFGEAAWVFAENDSNDDTCARLQAWRGGHPGFHLLSMANLAMVPARTVRLESARNACLAHIRATSELARADRLVVLDLDEPNTRPVDLDAMARALAFLEESPDRVAAFPNQDGPYYDVWALRHPKLCPDDVWGAVFDHQLRHRCDDSDAFRAVFLPRLHRIPPRSSPIEVESAFGGMGLYRLAPVLANPHPYLGSYVKLIRGREVWRACRFQTCEHVHFHEGLRRMGGRLHILPFLINCDTGGFSADPTTHRRLVF